MLKTIKKILKMATKQELEQQLAEAVATAQRLNDELKLTRAENNHLKEENNSLNNNLIEAIERVRYLDGQIRMLESQRTASTKYSDKDKNY